MIPAAPDALSTPILAAAFVSCALLLLLLGDGRAGRKAVARRIQRVRETCFEVAPTPKAATGLARREQAARFGTLATVLQKLLPRPETVRERLEQAGMRIAPGDLAILCLGGTLLLAGVLWAAGLSPALAAPAAFSAVFGGAAIHIGLARRRRAKKFLALLPEAIDLVVRAVKSGLPVSEAIALIGEEVEDPVGEVFREVASNMHIGMSTEEALWAAVRRVDLAEFRFLVVSITLQRETGGNLTGILANLATMVRRREQMKLKVRAMSSEARSSAMIIGALPFLVGTVIFFVNPDYMMKLFVDPRGQMLALAGLGSLTLGILVIARLVRFEI